MSFRTSLWLLLQKEHLRPSPPSVFLRVIGPPRRVRTRPQGSRRWITWSIRPYVSASFALNDESRSGVLLDLFERLPGVAARISFKPFRILRISRAWMSMSDA